MTKNSQILEEIYDYAEKNLLIKNKTDFAKYIGFSRGYVDKIIKSKKGAPDEWVKKARKLVDKKIDTNSTINVSGELSTIAGERIEWIAAMRGAINILVLKCTEQDVRISEIEMKLSKPHEKVFKQSFSDASLRLKKMMQDETEQVLAELRKK